MAAQHIWRPILFECPRTGSKVQVLVQDDPAGSDDARYETVSCPACASTHLVNARTGIVLGATKPR